jgi:hypothetical protein
VVQDDGRGSSFAAPGEGSSSPVLGPWWARTTNRREGIRRDAKSPRRAAYPDHWGMVYTALSAAHPDPTRLVDTWPIILCAGRDVGECLRHAGSRKGGVLLVQRFGDSTDPHITYLRATTRWRGCMRISVCHTIFNNPWARSIYPRDSFLTRSG